MPPSSPVLSSEPPPPGWRSMATQDSCQVESLQVAQTQAARLRALHAAVIQNKSFVKNQSPVKIRPQRCSSPSSATCVPRYNQDYPIFTPSYDEFFLGEKRTYAETGRNSVDPEASSGPGLDTSVEKSSSLYLTAVEITPRARSISELIRKGLANPGYGRPGNVAKLGSASHRFTAREFSAPGTEHRLMAEEWMPLDLGQKKPLSAFFHEEGRKETVLDEVFVQPNPKKPTNDINERSWKNNGSEVPDAGMSCDGCRPVSVGRESTTVVPLMDSRDLSDLPPHDRADAVSKDRTGNNLFKAWFSRVKKTRCPRAEASPTGSNSKERLLDRSLETTTHKEVEAAATMSSMDGKAFHASKRKDAAAGEVVELRSAMGEMGKKLEQLELYCQSMKQAMETRSFLGGETNYGELWEQNHVDYVTRDEEQLWSFVSPAKPVAATKSEFFHAVTEARVAVKQLCRTLVQRIQETENPSAESIGRSSSLRRGNPATEKMGRSSSLRRGNLATEKTGSSPFQTNNPATEKSSSSLHLQTNNPATEKIGGSLISTSDLATEKISSSLLQAGNPAAEKTGSSLIQAADKPAAEKFGTSLLIHSIGTGRGSSSKVSRAVRYHVESLINQALFENFENVSFESSGTDTVLDPTQRCHACYKAYRTLGKLRFSEILRNNSNPYSDSFGHYCEEKMNRIEALLDWHDEDKWAHELLSEAFFTAARCIWLLHLMAFSFHPIASIFRVGRDVALDLTYMEVLPCWEQPSTGKKHELSNCSIRIMVMPGFFLHNHIVKCKVLCDKA